MSYLRGVRIRPYEYGTDKCPVSEGEYNDEPSMTVPDESLSVTDIIYRFTKGLPLDNVMRTVRYGDDSEQSDDDMEVHPANTFDHDILDLLEKPITPIRKHVNDDDLNDDEKQIPNTGKSSE